MAEEKKFDYMLNDSFQYCFTSSRFSPVQSMFVNLVWQLTFHCNLESYCFESMSELAKAFHCEKYIIFRSIKSLLNKKVILKVSNNRYMINKKWEEWETTNDDFIKYHKRQIHLAIGETSGRQPLTPSKHYPQKKVDATLGCGMKNDTSNCIQNGTTSNTEEHSLSCGNSSDNAGLECYRFEYSLQGIDVDMAGVEVVSNTVSNTVLINTEKDQPISTVQCTAEISEKESRMVSDFQSEETDKEKPATILSSFDGKKNKPDWVVFIERVYEIRGDTYNIGSERSKEELEARIDEILKYKKEAIDQALLVFSEATKKMRASGKRNYPVASNLKFILDRLKEKGDSAKLPPVLPDGVDVEVLDYIRGRFGVFAVPFNMLDRLQTLELMNRLPYLTWQIVKILTQGDADKNRLLAEKEFGHDKTVNNLDKFILMVEDLYKLAAKRGII